MSQGPVVSNSSPLIALDQIGRLALLHDPFSTVVVPPAVVRETSPRLALPAWVTKLPLGQPIGARVLSASLGCGEREAICLAVECNARWLVLDDRPARRLAASLALPRQSSQRNASAAAKRWPSRLRNCRPATVFCSSSQISNVCSAGAAVGTSLGQGYSGLGPSFPSLRSAGAKSSTR